MQSPRDRDNATRRPRDNAILLIGSWAKLSLSLDRSAPTRNPQEFPVREKKVKYFVIAFKRARDNASTLYR